MNNASEPCFVNLFLTTLKKSGWYVPNEYLQYIKLDEHNHVEKQQLNQLTGKVRSTSFLTEPQEAGA